jgi:NAD(P)-dependent dehydrogenase (short-subunit alcohol dehydrogenase family)
VRTLVVGGSRRLGAALAVELAGGGADVIVSSRTPAAAAPVVARIEGLGRRGAAVGGDVGSRLEAVHIVRCAAETLGGLDLVVFAASGPFDPMPPQSVDEETWAHSMDVIARGFLFCAQAAREVFLERAAGADTGAESIGPGKGPDSPGAESARPGEASGGTGQAAVASGGPHAGTVVALTDIVEGDPWPGLSPHYAAKAAEIMLVRLLGAAWKAEGVWVSGVGPGPVDLPDDDHRDANLRAAKRLGYPRMLWPSEVAAAILECTRDPRLRGVNRTLTVE